MHLHDKAFYIALFFIIGVAAASFGVNIWISAFVVYIIGVLAFSWEKQVIIIAILLTFFGSFYFNFYEITRDEKILFEEEQIFSGVIARQPRHGLHSQQLDIELGEPYRGKVRIYTATLPRFEFGEKLEFTGVIKQSPSGRLNTVLFPDIEVVGEGKVSGFRQKLFKIKDRLVKNLQEVLPPKHAALMSGLLFGERAEFTDEFEDAMIKSGTTHIVALSGYNVAIIGITLSAMLSYFLNRRKAFYISVFAIISFILMTGAEASVVRAGIMGIVALFAERQSRIYSFRNAIVLAALVMLLFNPRLFVFDIGFQLSFAALLGIVYIYPLIKRRFEFFSTDGVLGWRRNLLQTFSAQIAVAPIILTTFGYLSPTALIANVLILEFIPITMLLGFITAILGFLPFGLSLVTGWVTSLFLGYEIFIINFFSFNWL